MKHLFAFVACLWSFAALGQVNMLKSLDSTAATKKENVTATFKATRIVSGQSIEVEHGGVLNFVIQHRFGPVNGGNSRQAAYEFFGLDQASLRIGFDMGLTNDFNIGIGRSNVDKLYDGYAKYKILKQKIHGFPLTVTWYSSMAIRTVHNSGSDTTRAFSSRLFYTHQLLIGSRVTPSFSVQLSPTLVHRNFTSTAAEKNDVFAVGIGARQKISKRVSINGEYFYVLPNQLATGNHNSLSLGFDIETGGHVFQIHLTNSFQMADKGFITETTEDWRNGGIHIGFNITRVFTLYQY